MFNRFMCRRVLHNPEKLVEIAAQARKTAEAWPVERGVEMVLESATKIMSAQRNKCEF